MERQAGPSLTQTRSHHLTSVWASVGAGLQERARALEMVTLQLQLQTQNTNKMMFQALLWLSLLSAVSALEYPKVVETED